MHVLCWCSSCQVLAVVRDLNIPFVNSERFLLLNSRRDAFVTLKSVVSCSLGHPPCVVLLWNWQEILSCVWFLYDQTCLAYLLYFFFTIGFKSVFDYVHLLFCFHVQSLWWLVLYANSSWCLARFSVESHDKIAKLSFLWDKLRCFWSLCLQRSVVFYLVFLSHHLWRVTCLLCQTS